VRSAACQHLQLSLAQSTATLDAGSRLDLQAFAAGWAIDRAVEVLKEKGVATALVRSGTVFRGFGAGPGGKGWKVSLPAVPGQDDPPAPIWLRDRALATADRQSRLFHQRTGQPASGALAVFAVTELAIDAQAVAASSLITGAREGQMRMGSIRPRPSLLWALGSGEGSPLWIEYLWSAVPKR
jgi:FAD:protein FMN transferase